MTNFFSITTDERHELFAGIGIAGLGLCAALAAAIQWTPTFDASAVQFNSDAYSMEQIIEIERLGTAEFNASLYN